MQVKLKNFFSTATTTVEITTNDTHEWPHSSLDDEPVGICSYLESHLVGLFVIGETLFLAVDGRGSEIGDHRVHATLSSDEDNRRLEISVNGSTILLEYKNETLPVSTQFYSEDEEDADFGQWLTNVLVSDERRNIFVQSWRKT